MQVMEKGELRDALSTTHEETEDIIRCWWPKAKMALKKKGYRARTSMDNIGIQRAASGCGLHKGDKIELPPIPLTCTRWWSMQLAI